MTMVKSRKTCIMCKTCRDENLTYHRFPSNQIMLETWCDSLGLDLNMLPKYAYVCSKHFYKTDFIKSNQKTNLFKHAVPKHADCIVSTMASSKLASTSKQTSNTDTASFSGSSRTFTASDIANQSPVSSPEALLKFCGASQDSFIAVGNKIKTTKARGRDSSSTSSSRTLTASELDIESPVSSPGCPTERLRSCIAKGHKRKFDTLDILFEDEKENLPAGFTINYPSISSQKTKKRKANIPRHFGDIEFEDLDDPNMRKTCWNIAKKTINILKKKINNLQAIRRRRENKIYSLERLTDHLRRKQLISENAQITLNGSMSESAKQLFSRLLKKSGKKYSPELRQFALTLNFYSKKAYNYVRHTFSNILPHTRTLSKWYANVNASPGFMEEALSALKIKCMDAARKGNKILCNLVLDEMSIRKKIEWDGIKTYGYVDLGIHINSEELEEAREALVFMVVSLNSSWKVPVGYFLTNGLTSSEKANLLTNCLEFIHQSSVVVTSITFDGAPSNIAMANKLGANLNVNNLKTYFIHPNTRERIYVFLDPCHMIKLVRNAFGSQKMLEDPSGSIISWMFLKKLCEIQRIQGLHTATKLRERHMSWVREKMKVSLAVQTLSKSVAEAIDFLNHDLNFPEFENSEATATFCRTFNNLFDIFNSRNVLTKKPFEKPFSQATENEYFKYINYCSNYIKNLKIEGRNILNTKKKVGFLGFLTRIESLKQLYTHRVKNNKDLKYILTYKLSQDHLEIFFSCIRSKGGYNNNPTSKQFQSIMKKLLIHSEISGSEKANAVALDSTAILHCTSASPKIEDEGTIEPDFNASEICFMISTPENLSLYCEDVIAYIAGFVVRKLKRILNCTHCLNIIETETVISKLQIRKTFGSLTRASQFVIDICKVAEKSFRSYKHLLYKVY